MDAEVSVGTIDEAAMRLGSVVSTTPLLFSKRLSAEYGAEIYLKREDLQEVRSYKIRGAYNLMSSLPEAQRRNGVVCASAGNHAQGVAMGALLLKTKAVIFMPVTTPLQKIARVRAFGGRWVDVRLTGADYDAASAAAQEYCRKAGAVFVHPFDDYTVMSGQGTVGKEIYDQMGDKPDYIICPVGGGGLISGVATYFKGKSAHAKIVGAEPAGSPSMYESIRQGRPVALERIDTFIDGAAVKRAGSSTFKVVKRLVDDLVLVQEGSVCTTMIELYQSEGMVVEPAGALSTAALGLLGGGLRGKTAVCVVSGGNNDILRYPEIMERSLVYRGLKHYFLIEFSQKPGQLRKFLDNALGPTDDIVRFEYMKKNSKETGPALVGIELANKGDLAQLLKRMEGLALPYKLITRGDPLYDYLI